MFGDACTTGLRHTCADEHDVMSVEQRVAPGGDVEPRGHAAHEIALRDADAVPTLQGVHELAPAREKVPAGQEEGVDVPP